jgi:competence protein ComEA
MPEKAAKFFRTKHVTAIIYRENSSLLFSNPKTTIMSRVDKEENMKFHGIRIVCVLTLCLVLLCGSMPALAQQAGSGSATAAKTAAAAETKINLNSATAEQLTVLPGIGAATARLIIEHRTNVGKFSRVEELMNVKGIGEKKFEAIKDLVTL